MKEIGFPITRTTLCRSSPISKSCRRSSVDMLPPPACHCALLPFSLPSDSPPRRVHSALFTAAGFVFQIYLQHLFTYLWQQELPFLVDPEIISGKRSVAGISGYTWVTQKKGHKTDVLRTEVNSHLASGWQLFNHFFLKTEFLSLWSYFSSILKPPIGRWLTCPSCPLAGWLARS